MSHYAGRSCQVGQPLTAAALNGRLEATYRAAGAPAEGREYTKRMVDVCCAMSSNRLRLK
jgi:hypothetical protein